MRVEEVTCTHMVVEGKVMVGAVTCKYMVVEGKAKAVGEMNTHRGCS